MEEKNIIEGVKIKNLKIIPDERGMLMEVFRRDDDFFEGFGQVYITTAYPYVVKAWHYHKKQSDNLTCLVGMVKLVLFDPRKGSPTKGKINEFFTGSKNPTLIHIPKNIYHGFKTIDKNEAIVLNITSEPYNYKNPDEVRLPWNDPSIPYNWERENG